MSDNILGNKTSSLLSVAEAAAKIMGLNEHKGTEPHEHPHKSGEFPGEDPNAPLEEATKSPLLGKPFEDLRGVADAALKIMTGQPQEVKEEEKETVEPEEKQLKELFGFSAKEKAAKAAKKEKEAKVKAKKDQEDKDWAKWNYWTKKAMNPGGTADDNKKAKELEKLPHVAARVKKMRDDYEKTAPDFHSKRQIWVG